jgi:tRNA pseudouridine55 synthase
MREPCDGLLVLDKPGGITSRDAVDRVLRWFPRGRRIGHTGTLDPLATGVLVMCLGRATRLTQYVQRMSKTYRTVIRLGCRSDTDDADGAIVPVPGVRQPDAELLTRVAGDFVGAIQQVPPVFSAAKVTGRRAYDLARKGEEVALQPRLVEIYRIDIISYTWPDLELEVDCAKGTYIRSLARDLGERLGCGGYVHSLRRTRVGPFGAESGLSFDASSELARDALLPVELAVADLPRLDVPAVEGLKLCQGQAVPMTANIAGEVAVFGAQTGRLLAVAMADSSEGLLRPVKVLGA